MTQDILSSALNNIMNAKKAGKKSCEINYSNKILISVLEIMKKNEYIESYKLKGDKFSSILVDIGKLNECKSIKPRFYVSINNMDKYIRRFLPAKDFGIIIISTSNGLMTHKDAAENNVGGSLIAYCF